MAAASAAHCHPLIYTGVRAQLMEPNDDAASATAFTMKFTNPHSHTHSEPNADSSTITVPATMSSGNSSVMSKLDNINTRGTA